MIIDFRSINISRVSLQTKMKLERNVEVMLMLQKIANICCSVFILANWLQFDVIYTLKRCR